MDDKIPTDITNFWDVLKWIVICIFVCIIAIIIIANKTPRCPPCSKSSTPAPAPTSDTPAPISTSAPASTTSSDTSAPASTTSSDTSAPASTSAPLIGSSSYFYN